MKETPTPLLWANVAGACVMVLVVLEQWVHHDGPAGRRPRCNDSPQALPTGVCEEWRTFKRRRGGDERLGIA